MDIVELAARYVTNQRILETIHKIQSMMDENTRQEVLELSVELSDLGVIYSEPIARFIGHVVESLHYMNRGDIERANACAVRSVEIVRQTNEAIFIAWVLMYYARLLATTNRFEEAMEVIEELEQHYFESLNIDQRTTLYSQKAYIHIRKAEYVKALYHFSTAMSCANLSDKTSTISSLYNDIAGVYFYLGDYNRALSTLQVSINLIPSSESLSHVTRTKVNLALLLLKTGKIDEAAKQIEEVDELYKGYNTDQVHSIALYKFVKAKVLLACNKVEEAKPLLKDAYQNLKKANDVLNCSLCTLELLKLRNYDDESGLELTRLQETFQKADMFDAVVDVINYRIRNLVENGEIVTALNLSSELNNYLLTKSNDRFSQSLESVNFTVEFERNRLERELTGKKNEELIRLNKSLEDFISINQRQSEDIVRYNQELQETNYALEQKNAEQIEFLDLAAHQVKGPLYEIHLKAMELSMEVKENSKEGTLVADIHKLSTKVFGIINSVLGKNSIEQAMHSYQLKETDVRSILLRVMADYSGQATIKRITFNSTIPGNTPSIWQRETAIHFIFDNLISNAIKYSPFNNTIDVVLTYSESESKFTVKVKDNGPGFTETDKEQMFSKFKRLSAQPTNDESSSGLGLYIVKKLTELTNCTLSLSTKLGEGSEFTISIPSLNP